MASASFLLSGSVDRDAPGLAAVATAAREAGVTVSEHGLDLTHEAGLQRCRPPSWRSTERAKQRFSRSLVTPPETVAARIVAGILSRKKRVLIGRDARLLDAAQRFAPTGYYALLRNRMGRHPASP